MIEYLPSTLFLPPYPFSIEKNVLYVEGYDYNGRFGGGDDESAEILDKRKIALPFTDASSIASITITDYSSTLIRKNGEVYVTQYEHTALECTDGLFTRLKGLPEVLSITAFFPHLYFVTANGRLGRKQRLSKSRITYFPIIGTATKIVRVEDQLLVLTTEGCIWKYNKRTETFYRDAFIPSVIKDIITTGVMLTTEGTIIGTAFTPFFAVCLHDYDKHPFYYVMSDDEEKWVMDSSSFTLL